MSKNEETKSEEKPKETKKQPESVKIGSLKDHDFRDGKPFRKSEKK